MAIRGDLLSVDLSNVFQMLAMNRKRGVLHLQNRGNILDKRALVLDADRVGLLNIPAKRDLAALLVDQGELSYEDYRDAVEKARQFKVAPVNYLLKRARLTNAQVEGALAKLQEEFILEIFLWKNVSFHLDEESWPEEDPERRFFVLDLTVMEAARRQDEWARVTAQIGGDKDIWSHSHEIANIEKLACVERIVHSHVDSVRGSQEITDATGLPRYHVDLALSNLNEQGFVRKLGLEDLIEVGDRLVKEGRHDDGIRLFKCAVRYDRRSIALHKRLAQAYLREDRVAKAAAHYKFCAISLVDKGLIREALAIYQYLMTILPTDFKSLEQGLVLLSQIDEVLSVDDRKTLDLGLKLCHFYFESNRYRDAQRVLDHLLIIAPDDIGLSYLQARVFAKSGQINEAIETYMRLAARLHAVGDLEGALNSYKLVVSFDSATKDICLQKMAEIRRSLAKVHRRKMAGVAFLLGVLLLVGAGVCYLYYHNSAEAEYDQVYDSEANIVNEQGWRAQAQRYAGFVERYPLTKASKRAKERQSFAESRARRLRQDFQKARNKVRDNERHCIRRAEENLNRAKGHLVVGDLKSALRSYEAAWQELGKSSQEPWGRHEDRKIPERIDEIKSHLVRETTALKEIKDALSKGNRKAAFDVARATFFAESDDHLSPKSVRVVSREAWAQVQVPLEIAAAPGDSLLVDDKGHDARGRRQLLLTAMNPRRRIEVSRTGFRTIEKQLSWDRSPFRTEIVLEKLPAERREIGDRIFSVALDGDAIVYLAGNGVVYRAKSLTAVPKSFKPRSFVTPSSPVVVANGGAAFGTTEGHVLFLHSSSKTRKNWDVSLSVDPIAGLVAFAETFIVATHDGHPKISFLSGSGKESKRSIALASPVVHLVNGGGRVLLVDQAGSLIEIDGKTGVVIGQRKGRFSGKPVVFLNSIFVSDDVGRIHQIAQDLKSSLTFDNRYRVLDSPIVLGNRLLYAIADGGVFEINAELQTRVLGREWSNLLRQSTGKLFPLDDGKFLLELRDGRQILIDAKSDRLLHAYRSDTGTRAISFYSGGRIVLACRDAHGAIEIYRE